MEDASQRDQNFAHFVSDRTVEENVPELYQYLSEAHRILDIGCGPGNITVSVAQAAPSAEVYGIDPVAYHIELASEAGHQKNLSNLHFKLGDGNRLPFDDDSFDIVYSHTVLHYFTDLRSAIKEQKRVTKPGGRIVASGVRDWGLARRYPECPSWDRLIEARGRYYETYPDRKKVHDKALGQTNASRQCPYWFAQLGMKQISVSVQPCRIQYSTAENMEPHLMDLLPWDDEDELGYYEYYRKEYNLMIKDGMIERKDITEALQEARNWFQDPKAFCFHIRTCITGIV
jgi:SAM-dependent methyltransferase